MVLTSSQGALGTQALSAATDTIHPLSIFLAPGILPARHQDRMRASSIPQRSLRALVEMMSISVEFDGGSHAAITSAISREARTAGANSRTFSGCATRSSRETGADEFTNLQVSDQGSCRAQFGRTVPTMGLTIRHPPPAFVLSHRRRAVDPDRVRDFVACGAIAARLRDIEVIVLLTHRGNSSRVRPSSRRPPDFGVSPPTCLK